MTVNKKFKKPISLADWAYEQIKEQILDLSYSPGEQLQLEELASDLGTSRTPAREAILRLEKDGLIQIMPRVGLFVTGITVQDLDELYELRELLESRAVERATVNMTEEDLAHLDLILETSVKAISNDDDEKFLQTEIEFHSFLYECSGNRRLVAMMETLRDLTYRWRVLSIRSKDSIPETLKEHQKITQALHRKDSEMAGGLMREHIRAARDRIKEILERNHLFIDLINHGTIKR